MDAKVWCNAQCVYNSFLSSRTILNRSPAFLPDPAWAQSPPARPHSGSQAYLLSSLEVLQSHTLTAVILQVVPSGDLGGTTRVSHSGGSFFGQVENKSSPQVIKRVHCACFIKLSKEPHGYFKLILFIPEILMKDSVPERHTLKKIYSIDYNLVSKYKKVNHLLRSSRLGAPPPGAMLWIWELMRTPLTCKYCLYLMSGFYETEVGFP